MGGEAGSREQGARGLAQSSAGSARAVRPRRGACAAAALAPREALCAGGRVGAVCGAWAQQTAREQMCCPAESTEQARAMPGLLCRQRTLLEHRHCSLTAVRRVAVRSWRRASQLVSSCDSSAESGLVLLHAQQCQPLRGAWVWLSPRAPGSASAAFGEGRIGTRRRTARDGSLHQCSCLRARAVARSRAGCFVGQPRRPASTEHCTLCAAGS